MQVTSNEFALLAALASGAPSSRRALAARTGLSSGSVGRTLKAVEDAGLVRDGALTQTGFDALEPYRVRNAVVMAAGLSSRCAPISYEKPKGLLRVRGERLIERQIRQLREAGIEDVTVVVGYKKEEFFYLEDAFGVDIVVNEDFAVRNNHATLFQVRDLLGATYVCSSDNYFTENPFEPYAYESYCAAVYIHGETDEYCLGTRGKERRIVSAALGGRDSWALMGHAYWTPSFAEAFMSILEAEYDKPETAPKLWEEVFFSHADELKMVMRPYPADVVHEFDSLDQLQSFDPEFIDNVGSGVLDNICSTLGCLRGDIVDVRPLQQGLTNLSFYFSCGGEGYVYRHPGAGTDDIINRQAETFALKAASDLGLDETYVYEDPRQGWKIARFVPGCSEFDYADAAQVERALKMARRLHTSGVVSPWSFDFYDESKKIEGLLREAGWEFPSDYDALAAAVADLVGPLRAGAGEPVLCHNDFYGPNILVHGDEMSLIDWEYAAMGDYGCDFGNFVAQGSGYTVEEAIAAIPRYFGRMPTPEEEFHLLACTALVGWYWYVWALYKECKGAPTGEWLYVWYKAAKEFGAYANGLLGRPGAPAGPAAAGGAPSLSYDEFTVLAGLEAAARGAVHPEAIDPDARTVALAALEERGLVREGALTDAGASALEPYRVERAVLLAAGFGSRLLPVTVNTPKPLARVHGVRIIDRLIDAMQAAGIKEVYVVRGYLSEEFDQLLRKYPDLVFIENPLYAKTNNISSAAAACRCFSNAYVFESDLFLQNPSLVSAYQYRSNYLAIPVERTDDWCFDAEEEGRIVHIGKGKEAPCWQMVGVSYWTAEDGKRLARDIPAVFAQEDGKQIFWDDVALDRLPDAYDVRVRPCSEDDIVEIDDFEDLQRIDPAYVVMRKGT